MWLVRKASAFFDRILNGMVFVTYFLLAFVMVLVSLDVVLRYAFSRPITGVLASSELTIIGIVSFGSAWLLREEGHVKIDIILSLFRMKVQCLISAVTSALAAAAFLIVTWYSLYKIYELIQTGATTYGAPHGFPQVFYVAPLTLCYFFLFLQLVRRSYNFLKQYLTKQ